jgi:ArsR family transcriptional regulator, arsenate/arsenite/antimonite-responsive transcriptional repressor
MNRSLTVLPSLCCGPDVAPLEPEAAEDLAAVFKALADPTRVGIVSRLASGEKCCVCDLTDAFELSQPTVSHHLRILRDAGLVEFERRGTFAYYWLAPEAIDRLQAVFRPPVPALA